MRKILKATLGLMILTGYLLCPFITAQAEEPVLSPANITVYNDTGIMRWGQQTRYGVCAGSEEYKDCMIVVYQRLPDGSLGDFIGMFECLDTGGTKGLNNGTVIDVWKPTMEECQQFIDLTYSNGCKGKVFIQVIKGKG